MPATTATRARRSFAADAQPTPPPPPAPVPAAVAPLAPSPVANGQTAADGPTLSSVRKPFGSHVQKLAYPEREGFHRHWFNDIPGRIARALEAGYAHVQSRDGKNVARVVGVAEAGGGLTAFLMEIPLEWYRADQKIKDDRRDEIDAKLRRGVVAGTAPGQDGAYLPVNQAGTLGPEFKKRTE